MLHRRRALLAVATGLLAWLAFPGVGAWPLAFVAWVPLLHALDAPIPAREAALLGWLAGLTMTALGTMFIVPAIHLHGGLSIVSSIAAEVALSAYQGVRIGLVALVAALARARGWPHSVAFLFAFAGAEVAFPEPFPWTFGACIHAVTPLAQVADLGGAPLLSVIVVAGNLGARAAATRRRVGLAWLVAPMAAVAYGLARLPSVERDMAKGATLEVGLVQPHLEMFHTDPTAALHVAASRDLARRGAELVVFSEAPLPGPYPEEDLDGALEASVTGRLGVPAIAGLVVKRTTRGGERYYFNSAIVTDGSGRMVGRYDKQTLLPFGEYMPGARFVSSLAALSPQTGSFSPGSTEPLEIPGPARPTISICYEDILPERFRALVAREQPNLLVNMTNDGWFEGSSEPRVHLELARVRAIEHRRYLVRATNAGVSAVIDAAGRTVAIAREHERTTLLAEVRLLDQPTVYETLGDGPEWGALGAALALALVPQPTRRRGAAGARRE